ncbi:MAG: PilZ domain-containing protein [Acidobacteriia bacterium]|nr:PilZ domain-containing protein [Terriglobia bacterium]
MGERRKARRYEIYLPVQVCLSGRRPVEFCTGQLRDISRMGIYFLSDVELEPGTAMELTFALPTESDRKFSVLVRASARALRTSPLEGDITPVYGVAASIDRLDFVRPVAQNAAA